MTFKAVTTAQLEQVRKMANDKGIGKDVFQRGLDDGIVATMLNRINSSATVAELVPPDGGRIHIVRVPVRLDREWQEAINAAGPDNLDNYNVCKVGDQYPPASNGTVEETEVILMNFGVNGGSWNKAIAWAKQYQLKRTNPRHAFSIAQHKPQLHHELGFDYMYAVATEECSFVGYRNACYVWWHESKRQCHLRWLGDCGSSFDWFAFLRE